MNHTNFLNERAKFFGIHVSFKRIITFDLVSFIYDKIQRTSTVGEDMRFGCIKVHIRRDTVARLDKDRGKNCFRCSSLMNGYK